MPGVEETASWAAGAISFPFFLALQWRPFSIGGPPLRQARKEERESGGLAIASYAESRRQSQSKDLQTRKADWGLECFPILALVPGVFARSALQILVFAATVLRLG